jgi:hypothetical protein
MEFGWAHARPTWFSSRSDDRRDGIDQRQELGGIMCIGRRKADPQQDAVAIHRQVVLGAGLTAVNGVRASLFAPLLARTLSESTLALDQSIAASSPSQLSSLESNFSQTPASCQSCSRRQQVVSLPQPNSFGSSRQGQPVRCTKTMPPRAARSGTRGRPPFGFGGSLGCRRSIAS